MIFKRVLAFSLLCLSLLGLAGCGISGGGSILNGNKTVQQSDIDAALEEAENGEKGKVYSNMARGKLVYDLPISINDLRNVTKKKSNNLSDYIYPYAQSDCYDNGGHIRLGFAGNLFWEDHKEDLLNTKCERYLEYASEDNVFDFHGLIGRYLAASGTEVVSFISYDGDIKDTELGSYKNGDKLTSTITFDETILKEYEDVLGYELTYDDTFTCTVDFLEETKTYDFFANAKVRWYYDEYIVRSEYEYPDYIQKGLEAQIENADEETKAMFGSTTTGEAIILSDELYSDLKNGDTIHIYFSDEEISYLHARGYVPKETSGELVVSGIDDTENN